MDSRTKVVDNVEELALAITNTVKRVVNRKVWQRMRRYVPSVYTDSYSEVRSSPLAELSQLYQMFETPHARRAGEMYLLVAQINVSDGKKRQITRVRPTET